MFLLFAISILVFFCVGITVDPQAVNKSEAVTVLYPRSLLHACLFFMALAIIATFLAYRRSCSLLFAIMPLTLVLAAGHGEALVGLCLLCVASIGLGNWLLEKLRTGGFQTSVEWIMAFYIGIGINAYITWIIMHWPVNYVGTYVLLFLSEIFFFRKHLRTLWSALYPAISSPLTGDRAVFFVFSTMFLVYALVPTYGGDEMVKHLYIPTFVARNHLFTFDPVSHLFGFDTSIIPLASYVMAFLTGGEFAIRLLNWLLVILTCWIVLQKTSQWFDRRTGVLAMTTAFLTPVMLWITALIFADSFPMLASTLVIICTLEYIIQDTPNPKHLVIYSIIIPLLVLSKQNGVLVVLATLPLIFVKSCIIHYHDHERPRFKGAVLSMALATVVVLPILIHNYIIAGNPVFPFANHFFQSPYFPSVNFEDGRWKHPLKLTSLWDMTFHGRNFSENIDCSIGFSYLIFLPLVLLAIVFAGKKHRHIIYVLSLISLIYVIAQFKLSIPYLRYFAGAIFPLACLTGISMATILNLPKRRFLQYGTWTAMVAVLLANAVATLSTRGGTPQPFPFLAALSGNYQGSTIKEWLILKRSFDYINATRPTTTRCLVFIRSLAFLNCEADLADWAHPSNNQAIMAAKTPEEAYDVIFNKLDYDVLVLPDISGIPSIDTPVFRGLLTREYQSSWLNVYTSKKSISP